MNQRTAKLLGKFASQRGFNPKHMRRDWQSTPWRQRAGLRRRLREVVPRPKRPASEE